MENKQTNLPAFAEGSRFLVTGGAGFIGSNLCEALLNEGYFVRCFDNFSTGKRENIEAFLKNPRFELMEADIRELEACKKACEGIDYVTHQAAWGSVPRSIEYPLLYEEINIRGTLNMMEAARQCKVKKFVFASSSSVYGDEPALPKKEGREGNLLSPYSLTKRVGEEYAKLYSKLYGLETVGFRYFNVFGRRQNPNGPYAAVIPKFILTLMNDQAPVINGDGLQSRDFTYIENVIQANFKGLAAPSAVSGEIFNIAYGGQIRLIDLFHTICTLLGKNIEPGYGLSRAGDIRHSNADITKARELLGYEPMFSCEEGIRLTVDWYKDDLYNK